MMKQSYSVAGRRETFIVAEAEAILQICRLLRESNIDRAELSAKLGTPLYNLQRWLRYNHRVKGWLIPERKYENLIHILSTTT